MWYWIFKYVLIGPILWLMGRPRIEGAENVPSSGPIIVAGNHLTVVDSFFLVLVMRRRVKFVAKSEYFSGHGLKGRLISWFYTSAGQVPVDRSGSGAGEPALNAARKILAEGGIWAIYPEGTRSPDGRLYKGKTGMARVALESGAPVVPVVMFGTKKFNPVGSKMWRQRRSSSSSVHRWTSRATESSRGTVPSFVRSPTRSCTRSCPCPGRSTSTSTQHR